MMTFAKRLSVVVVFTILSVIALPPEGKADDSAGMTLHRVADNIYALVGALGQRDRDNLGNNATFGFVVTEAGVVLIDSGATRKGAQAIEAAIRSVTDQPIRLVINSGGQDHRWLGNGYFQEQGATVMASEAARADQERRVETQLAGLSQLVGSAGVAGTAPRYADQTIADRHSFTFGGEHFQLLVVGPAHTPGDMVIWMPQHKLLFAGDVIYLERMLGVGPQSNASHWLAAFAEIETLAPQIVVPGHGHPADLAAAQAQTRDYLRFLTQAIRKIIDQGGGLLEAEALDQSAFAHLLNFDQIAGKNANRVFLELEWE